MSVMRRPRGIKALGVLCYHKESRRDLKNTLKPGCSVFVNAYGEKVCQKNPNQALPLPGASEIIGNFR